MSEGSTHELSFSQEIIPKGIKIIHQGEKGDCAYLIESGQLEVTVKRGSENYHINTLGEGEIVGEMAMIDSLPRTATVTALTDCRVIKIKRDEFSQRLTHIDPVLKQVMQVILVRYRECIQAKENRNDCKTESQNSTNEAFGSIKQAVEIKNALKNDEFIFHYQPIVCAKSENIVGFETLIRWDRPEIGLVFPDQFILVAEATGLVSEMTVLAFENACKVLKRLKDDSLLIDNFFISVNFSAKDISDKFVLDRMAELVSEYNIQLGQIHLEIVESLLIEKPKIARQTLIGLKDLGLHISIDDFGTGYSSLSYLHSFPFDFLKIDRSFVSKMLGDKNSFVLVKSIVALARNLDLQVIAEGVETLTEVQTIREVGADYIQGYYYSKPLPYNEAINFIVNNGIQ